MAHYSIDNMGVLGNLQGTETTAALNSDVIVFNESNAAITFTISHAVDGDRGTFTLDALSAMTIADVNPTTSAGAVTMTGGTQHRTSSHTGALVNFAISGTVATNPTVPTDNIDPDS